MPRKATTLARFILVASLLLAITATAQDYRIRAKVDLFVVPVTVKGSGDTLVTGLTEKDFAVFEDGRQQTITNFTSDPVPLSVAVVVDTGLPVETLSRIQKSVGALAGSFSEFDEIAIYRYDKFVTQIMDFSDDSERIQTAMNILREVQPGTYQQTGMPRGPFSIPGPVINGAAVVPPGQVGVIQIIPPKISEVLHDAVFTAAEDLSKRDRERRKIVLLISGGETRGSEHTFDQTAESLLQKGVQVFSIGLDQPFKKLSVLDAYAKTTGGDVYFADSVRHMEQSYASATEEARNQYVIGYISSNEVIGAGPVFRGIEVHVAGRNLKALHRKGYYQYP